MSSKWHFDEPFKLYHLSKSILDGQKLEPRPMSRTRVMEGEDWKVPRICVSSSIDGALSSLVDSVTCPYGMRFWVHVPIELEELFKANKVHRPSLRQVPDAEVTGEHWLKAPATMKAIGQIEVEDIDENVDLWFMWKGAMHKLDRFKWKWTVCRVQKS